MKNFMNIKKYSPLVLRAGLCIVFIWFGSNQITNQQMWLSLIPTWAISITGLTAKALVIGNGIFEICMAVLLAIGFQIRIVATLLFLHLIMIVGDLGLNAVGIRDLGLTFAALSVALHGADEFSCDAIKSNPMI